MSTGADFNDVDSYGLLKELYSDESEYQDTIVSSFYNFLRHASSGEVEFDGKYWNEGVVLQLNESYAAINDNERLPNAGYPKGLFAKYRPKLMYSSIEMTTYAATRGHKNGRVGGKFIEDTVKGSFMTFNSNLDFDALGNGRGFRATIATATPAADNFTVEFSTRLRSGMQLDWYNSTLTTKRGSIQIDLEGIDRMARQVYIDPAFATGAVPAGATAGDVLVVYGALAAGEPTDGRYMAGFDYLTDNTVSLGGLSASSYKLWAATVLNAAGANPNQEILQQLWDALWIISNTQPNKMAFNPAWKRGYLNGFLNQRMFTSNQFETGASNLSFSPVRMGKDENTSKKVVMLDMLEDRNMDPTKVNIFSDQAFCVAHDYGDNPHLADEDGSDFRFRRNYDSLNGFIRFWANTVVKRRNAIGQIYGFTSASGVI